MAIIGRGAVSYKNAHAVDRHVKKFNISRGKFSYKRSLTMLVNVNNVHAF